MSAPNKEQRAKCWAARDEYWDCLDKNNGDQNQDKCQKIKEEFEGSCTKAWVKYFDRRRDYLKYKAKIDNEGFEPVNAKQ